MKLLIIGGTGFLGRHLTALALNWGHAVTLFNRAHRQHPDWRELTLLKGDRDRDLSRLQEGGQGWDLVIDTSCHSPEQALTLSAALRGRCERVILISAISACAEVAGSAQAGTSSPGGWLADSGEGETGRRKADCEAAYYAHWGEQLCVLRPGVLCGPHDPAGPMTWWLRRIAQGGPMLLPGQGRDRLQYLDVRDCAEFVLRAAEQQLGGCFNLLTPGIALQEWIERLAARLEPARALQPEWVPWPAMLAAGIKPWQSYPMLLPNAQGPRTGYGHISAEAAIVQGLNFRPLEETVTDLAHWLASSGGWRATGIGLTGEDEQLVRQRLLVTS